jgi:hypothetical protein
LNGLITLARRIRTTPDLAIVAGLTCFFFVCSAVYLPGLAAGLAWQDFDDPVFYANRFALPHLFPNDLWASYQRDVYPFNSLVHAVPALLWKFLAVPPIYPTFVELALNDLLIVLAVYWLCRALFVERVVSLACALFAVTSQMLSWNLAGYPYLGHTTVYAGSFVIPFAIAVIPSLMQRRVAMALVFAALALLVYPPFGVAAIGTIAAYLLVQGEASLWRAAARWAIVPALAMMLVSAVQFILRAQIAEPLSHAQDLQIVMANGHFVPPWTHGREVLGNLYIGFCAWSLLGVLAVRHWVAVQKHQRDTILCLFAIVFASFAAWIVAYQLEWLLVLRTSLFRHSLMLTIVGLPFVMRYLLERVRDSDYAVAVVSALVLVLMMTWMLPLALPGIAFLAVEELRRLRASRPSASEVGDAALLPRTVRHLRAMGVALWIAVVIDVVFGGGIFVSVAARIETTGRLVRMLQEQGQELPGPRLELVLLAVVALVMAWLFRRRNIAVGHGTGGSRAVAIALCVFMFVCVAVRSTAQAVWWAKGDPEQLAQVELWAKHVTPLAAKFIFFETDPRSRQLSWQTLSERGAAELKYTHQKAYIADKRLLDIDSFVSALYQIDKPDPYHTSTYELFEKYRRFHVDDFLRVGRLSRSNFVVLRKPRALPWPVAFGNDLFVAYRLPAQFEGVQVVIDSVTRNRVALSWSAATPATLPSRLSVGLRDVRTGTLVASESSPAIDGSSGQFTMRVPDTLPAGTYLPVISVGHELTGPIASSEAALHAGHEASWEYLVLE